MILQDATILFQGDSITDAGRSREVAAPNQALGEGYAMMTAAQLLADHPADGLRIWNRGVGGNKVTDLAARWEEDCLALQPNVLSIMIGVNDTCHNFGADSHLPVAEYEQIYRNLLATTLERLPKIKLVLCEPFLLRAGNITAEMELDLDGRREVVRQLAGTHGAVLVPFQEMFDRALGQAPAEYWAGDGVHPSYGGHMLMAREWLRSFAG